MRQAALLRLLRRSHDVARQHRPVLILGEARSGTSLLYRSLLQHPSFAGPGVNMVESGIDLLSVFAHALDDHDETKRAIGFLGPEAYAAWREDIAPVTALTRRFSPRFRSTDRDLWWRATAAPLVIRDFYWHARHGRAVSRVADKTPNRVDWAWRLRHALPGATLLYIHRDPAAVYASYLRRAAHQPSVAGTFGLTRDEFVDHWRFHTTRALQAARDPNVGLHLVSYERLVTDPEIVLAQVCGAINEDYSPSMLTVPDPELTHFPPDPYISQEIQAFTHDLSKWVTDDEATAIRDELSFLVAALAELAGGSLT